MQDGSDPHICAVLWLYADHETFVEPKDEIKDEE